MLPITLLHFPGEPKTAKINQDFLFRSHNESMQLQNIIPHKSIWHGLYQWFAENGKCLHLVSTCRASRFETAIAPTYGRLSITASAKSEMKVGSHPRAGTRPHFSIPELKANSLYSTSISSRVSICSLTKLWIKESSTKILVSLTLCAGQRERDDNNTDCNNKSSTRKADVT